MESLEPAELFLPSERTQSVLREEASLLTTLPQF
jgi:hypothetical protein